MEHRTLVLGVELYPYVPAVFGELYCFDKTSVGVLSSTDHSCSLEVFSVLAVELKAVSVTLTDEICSIGIGNL